jgi:hypothetical protein
MKNQVNLEVLGVSFYVWNGVPQSSLNSDNTTFFIVVLTCSKVPCWTQAGSKSVKQRNYLELGARSQLLVLKRVEGRAEALEWD